MREILFRGKRADNGEWICGHLLEQHDPVYKAYIVFDFMAEQDNIHTDIMQCDIYEVLPETVGQYTGLTDKNGKKIFEGDIVKTHYANAKKSDFVETVVFHNGKFCAFHSNNDCKQWTMLYDGVKHLSIDKSVYMDSVKIIGNIHDNPELLKGGEYNETPH